MDNNLKQARAFVDRNVGFNRISAYDLRNALAYVIAHLETHDLDSMAANLADHEQHIGVLERNSACCGDGSCEADDTPECCSEDCTCADDDVADTLHEMIEDALARNGEFEVNTRYDSTSGVMRHSLKVDWVS